MKLSKENILFIDTYLENSEIHYADIRMEMVDHIASSIELKLEQDNTLSFYEAFKAYMINNKANLIQNNKVFLKNTDKKIIKQMGLQFVKPPSILLFVLTIFSTVFVVNNYGLLLFKSTIYSLPILSILALGFVYLLVLRVFNYDRFSGVERVGFIFFGLYNIINFLQFLTKRQLESEEGYWFAATLFGLTVSLIYSFTITAILIMKKHKQEFNLSA